MSAPGGRRLREGESDNNLVVTPSARCRTPPEKSIAELQPEEKPVTFTELDDGQMIVERSQRKREAHPERLDLDRRRLRACPVIKNDDRLRLLNLQNNNIESISNLQNLPHLVRTTSSCASQNEL
jgi:Leucine-rich repeat (LRR) protein